MALYTSWRNLTPHKINVRLISGEIKTIDPENKPLRVESKTVAVDKRDFVYCDWFAIYEEVLGELVLPEENSTLDKNIVSRVVASHPDVKKLKGEVYIPGPLIRDDEGNPIGCEGLIRIKKSDDKTLYEPMGISYRTGIL